MRVITPFLFCPALAFATTVATPPAGYFRLSAAAGSDTSMVLPLFTRSAGLAHIVSVTTNSVLLDLPDVADGQFAPDTTGSYYLQIRSGNLAGLMYRITSGTGSRLFLDMRGNDLANHPLGAVVTGAEGDLVCIRKAATIRDTLGTGSALALMPVPALAAGAYQDGDALFVPSDSGKFVSEGLRIAYLADAGWRKPGDLVTDVGNTVLLPGLAFTVRAAPGHDIEFFNFGYVPMGRFTVELPATGDGEVADVHVGLIGAGNVALQDSGLLTAQPVSSPIRSSIDDSALTDVVLGWKSGRIGMDRVPTLRYCAVGGVWYRAGVTVGPEQLSAGAGYILRLREGRAARFWVQTPAY